MSRDIDELDERIISFLQVDGRRPAAEIARELGIPRATVSRRIESLTNEGVVTIRAYANSHKIGLPIHVWIVLRVSLDQIVPASKALSSLKELRWVGTVSGGSNLLIEGFFSSSQHIHAFFTERLARISGIQQIETLHVLSLEKFTFDWTTMRHAEEDYGLSSASGSGLVDAADD